MLSNTNEAQVRLELIGRSSQLLVALMLTSTSLSHIHIHVLGVGRFADNCVLQLLVALMLTSATYSLVVGEHIPALGYLTLVDGCVNFVGTKVNSVLDESEFCFGRK
jgi:hypothetical protein